MELLSAGGLRPRRRLGQNFLVDGNLMRRLVACAEIDTNYLVVEVGGGTGGLTDLLAAAAGRVVCVEIDRSLFSILADRFHELPSVQLFCGDILESKHRLMNEVSLAIHGHEGQAGGTVKLVANLPYQVATPVVMNLLVDYPQVRRLCFTVQSEVGERIVARPNCKAYGPLSIISQAVCTIQTVAKLPAHMFWPQPGVESVMIRMDAGTGLCTCGADVAGLSTLVRGAFDHRRKTLRSALGYVLDEGVRKRVCQKIDATRRPESFSVKEWLEIYAAVREA